MECQCWSCSPEDTAMGCGHRRADSSSPMTHSHSRESPSHQGHPAAQTFQTCSLGCFCPSRALPASQGHPKPSHPTKSSMHISSTSQPVMTHLLPAPRFQPPARLRDKLQSPEGPPVLEGEAGRTVVLVSWQGSNHQHRDPLSRARSANPLLPCSSHGCSSQSQAAPCATTARPCCPQASAYCCFRIAEQLSLVEMSILQPPLHREVNGLKPQAREDPEPQVAALRQWTVTTCPQVANLHSLG